MRRRMGFRGRRRSPRRLLPLVRHPAWLAACAALTLVLAGAGTILLLLGGKEDSPAQVFISAPKDTAREQETGAPPSKAPSAQATQPAQAPASSNPAPATTLEPVEGYPVIARLQIEALSLDLPVIGTLSDAALKVAPCLYTGPSSPEYPGNIVITGHNNRDNSHFGRLDELEVGNIVQLSGPDGIEYRYEVYDVATIGPEDVAALEEYEGDYGLSLITCADKGKNRLLVRCRQTE